MPTPPILGPVSPCYISADIPGTIRFYQDALGFELRFAEPPEDPFFVIVGRNAAQLFFKAVGDAVPAQPNFTRHHELGWDGFIYVGTPDALAEEFATRQVPFHKPVRDRQDGLRGFEIADPNGYIFFFGCPIPELS